MDPDLEEIDLDLSDTDCRRRVKKVPNGDVFEASRAGDGDRLRYLLESGVNVNARDQWDSAALYYACLAGHLDAARMLLESGAICSERTFDGDRCHYAALNMKVRELLKAFEARPPPLAPLQTALKETFLACEANRAHIMQTEDGFQFSGCLFGDVPDHRHFFFFPSDVVFLVQHRAIEAHRVILSARSPFFKKKFETEWRDRAEVRFAREKLSYPALHSLVQFFYSDRLEVAMDDIEDLIRICRVCGCRSLQKVLEKEAARHKYAEYKALSEMDKCQKRFILQASSLPEEDRLSSSLQRMLRTSLSIHHLTYDHSDVSIKVDHMIFRCHQIVLAARSEYFRARLLHIRDFHQEEEEEEGGEGGHGGSELDGEILPCLTEHDLSIHVFTKILHYMYSDTITDIAPCQAEEMFDAASRYLLFPLKRVVADALLPHLQIASPAELCHWLILSDVYGVAKIREYCLDAMAANFEVFASTREFRAMLLVLPPLSGDSLLRTSEPSAPGTVANAEQGNLLDDLREKWLEAEAAELDKRDQSTLLFDRRFHILMLEAEKESSDIFHF